MTVNDWVFPKTNTAFESVVRDLTIENIRQFYENELVWIDKVRHKALSLAETREKSIKNEVNKMEYTSVNKNGQVYIIVTGGQIKTEEDGLSLVSACVEHGTNLLMIPAACLSEDFLRLSTRVAGLVLQKLRNYNIKAVAILDAESTSQRFREFLSESNRGQEFRIYDNFEDAETWLLGKTK